jgi:hypothetical protein
MINYKDLDDKEIEAILKIYDGSVVRFDKLEALDMFVVYFKDKDSDSDHIKNLNLYILDKKLQYREFRLNFLLKN